MHIFGNMVNMRTVAMYCIFFTGFIWLLSENNCTVQYSLVLPQLSITISLMDLVYITIIFDRPFLCGWLHSTIPLQRFNVVLLIKYGNFPIVFLSLTYPCLVNVWWWRCITKDHEKCTPSPPQCRPWDEASGIFWITVC